MASYKYVNYRVVYSECKLDGGGSIAGFSDIGDAHLFYTIKSLRIKEGAELKIVDSRNKILFRSGRA